MGPRTNGGFARAAGLTPKALRLYDPAQLDRARLIARLRRIGMPLAEIATVRTLPSSAAATAVTGYWQRVTADTAARDRLVALLVDDLSGGSTEQSGTATRTPRTRAAGCSPSRTASGGRAGGGAPDNVACVVADVVGG